MAGIRLIPLKGLNLDNSPQFVQAEQARFIKNLYYSLGDVAAAGDTQGAQTGQMKPIPSNYVYCPLNIPSGENIVIGTRTFKEVTELYVWVWNSLGNHFIFRVNGISVTAEVIKIDPCFNFTLDPK